MENSALTIITNTHKIGSSQSTGRLDSINALISTFTSICSFYSSAPKHLPHSKSYSVMSSHLDAFISSHNNLANSGSSLSERINSSILQPLIEFKTSLTDHYIGQLNLLNSSLSIIQTEEEKLKQCQSDYYKEYNTTLGMESESGNSLTENFNKKDANIDDIHDKGLKQRRIMEDKSQIYKDKLHMFNNISKEVERDYTNIMLSIYDTEENRLLFIKNLMGKYLTGMNKTLQDNQKIVTNGNGVFTAYEQFDDLTKFNDLFYNTVQNPSCKWAEMKFITYDKYKEEQMKKEKNEKDEKTRQGKKSIDKMTNIQNFILDDNDDGGKVSNKGDTIESKGNPHEDFVNINCDYFQTETEILNDTVERFMKNVFGEIEITCDCVNTILDYLERYNDTKDGSFINTFLKVYLVQRNKNYVYRLTNFTNFSHLSNIFNNLIINGITHLYSDSCEKRGNFMLSNNVKYELILLIIILGEKTNGNNNIYLSAFLSKNKSFKRKELWFDLIEYKYILRLNYECNEGKFLNESKKSFQQPKKLGSSLTHLFTGSKRKDYILENTGLAKHIEYYEDLSDIQKRGLNTNKAQMILNSVLKDFMNHMSNYNYGLSESLEGIVEICKKYSGSNEKLNFYVIYLNTSFYTVRKHFPNINQSKQGGNRYNNNHIKYYFTNKRLDSIKNKITEIKNNNIDSLGIKYRLQPKNYKEKIIILLNVLKYLPEQDGLSMMLLNIEINKKIEKKIYKLLGKRTKGNLPKHGLIWKSILRYSSLNKQFNYRTIISHILTNPQESRFNIIDLDVKRTNFKSKINESRTALANIGKAFVFIKSDIGYCQGMNYIASFVYQITNRNEEDTFFLLIGLFSYSELNQLFIEDMEKIKIFYYIFYRLLYLFMPDIYEYFKRSSVSVNYFATPWFITLFTNTYTYTKMEDSWPLITIWDAFLGKGWNRILSYGLAMLKFNYERILGYQGDDGLQFVINDLVKSDFFKEKEIKTLLRLQKEFRMDSSIVRNLEEEIMYSSKIEGMSISLLMDKSFLGDEGFK